MVEVDTLQRVCNGSHQGIRRFDDTNQHFVLYMLYDAIRIILIGMWQLQQKPPRSLVSLQKGPRNGVGVWMRPRLVRPPSTMEQTAMYLSGHRESISRKNPWGASETSTV